MVYRETTTVKQALAAASHIYGTPLTAVHISREGRTSKLHFVAGEDKTVARLELKGVHPNVLPTKLQIKTAEGALRQVIGVARLDRSATAELDKYGLKDAILKIEQEIRKRRQRFMEAKKILRE